MTGLEVSEIASGAGLDAALAIRRAVFCVEQGVPEAIEIDGRDAACRHYLARLDGVAVGTARVRPLEPGTAKIERVAVLAPHRGLGVGRALMLRVLADLAASGTARSVLHAQETSCAFYAALGFEEEGRPFEEAGIPHVRMAKPLR